MLRVFLTIVQVFSSLAIIGLVLLQRGKGAEAGAGFGAGASGTVFGARGASTALSRATAIFAAVFMINSLLLTYMGTHSVGTSQPKSILDVAGEKAADKSGQGANKPGLTPAPASTGSSATAPQPPAPSATAAPAAPPAETAPAPAPGQPVTTAPPSGTPPSGPAHN
jgi:preprotein translocase subunit SecG